MAENAQDTPAPTEPIWSIWLALAFLVLWVALVVTIPSFSLGIAAFLKAPADLAPNGFPDYFAKFLEVVQASPMMPVGLVACMLLTWIVTFGVLEAWFRAFPRDLLRRALGIRPPVPMWSILAAIPVGVLVCMLGEVVAESLLKDETPASGFEEMMKSIVGRAAITFLALVLAPPTEEIFFRGFLYPPMERLAGARPGASLRTTVQARIAAVLLNAAVFALAHVFAYGPNPGYLVPVLLLGLTVASLRAWSGSVWPGIVAHAAFNGTSLFLFAFFGNQ